MSIKIGIITYHHTINYGAILQTYAIFKFLQNKGYEVEVIDYRPESVSWEEKRYLYLSKYFLLNPLGGIKRKWNMNKFIDKYIKLSPGRFYNIDSLTQYNHAYDYMICGSDEIWNINLRGLDKAYFLDFVSNQQTLKFSYAASFGSTKVLGIDQPKISEIFKQFHAISVRDTNSVKLVKQCGFHADKVIDPTFLINYQDVIIYPKIKNKYLLVYGSLTISEAEYVKILAEKEGLEIISIGSHNFTKFGKLDLFDISPEKWLGFFSQASFVVTKFYHGVIFSLIFNKPFIVFEQQSKSVKINDLLSMLNLKQRMLSLTETDQNKIKISNDHNLWSYIMTDSEKNELNKHIEYSQDYLLYKALK
ncbi:polysaccharide pyruvyl transferase family protein [Anabaenopsis tanganyikae CS-531]|uniref:Polysaccharide pyruvyl transferase family protein n=2 Tax=Anabaenopsis TaxID=110103 RepID=A0ABT5AVW6_9CYAN|nr:MULTISPECIES: polysaccharide pyruvyl transferase family protein [Anabaenopsis]MDB9541440.1 polysaccharide pyruvyl transferase family protein [Anabaenopsis arnoldii]MDH6090419.1 polysaccharide pyruvyl transferase family protein [Anabaenopsis arnoldii]MDH6107412.1 polysaccharide pyruvyl transferase family protein [Anabaenopsis tanganyikae CS-531]